MSKDFNNAHRILDTLCQGSTIGEVHTKCVSKKYHIYRSEKGYLPWIWYIAHQKKSSTPYDGIVAGGWGTTKGTPTGKSVPLPEEVYPYRKISSSTERIFTLY